MPDPKFDRLRRSWDRLGEADPLWAVLTEPGKRGNQWDPAEFFATGAREVEEVLHATAARVPDFPRGRALDFGCGVGRLTRALAAHFRTAVGVDVAASMIRAARELNADVPNCEFILNERPDLAVVDSGSVDFVYSSIVLQHIEPAYAGRYIREFLRILSPGGAAVFQVPSGHDRSLVGRLLAVIPAPVHDAYARLRYGPDRMRMYAIRPPRVRAVIREAGGEVVGEDPSPVAGVGWESVRYTAKRAGAHAG